MGVCCGTSEDLVRIEEDLKPVAAMINEIPKAKKATVPAKEGRLEEMVTKSLEWYRSLSTQDREKLDAYNQRPKAELETEFYQVWN